MNTTTALNALATEAKNKAAEARIGYGAAKATINGKEVHVIAMRGVSNMMVHGNNYRLNWKVNGKVCAAAKLNTTIEA